MDDVETYELILWDGYNDLPSVDLDCIIVYAYMRSIKKHCRIKYSSNPFFNSLPDLCVKKEYELIRFIDLSDFGEKWYHRKIKDLPDLDSELSPEQQIESRAYYLYLKECLLPCILDKLWVREEIYSEETKQWYGGGLFPFGLFYPWWRRKRTMEYVRSLASEDDSELLHSHSLLSKAKTCLDNLSAKLNEKQFLLGTNSPCTIDIITYAYLELLTKAPLGVLSTHTVYLDNLVFYMSRVNAGWLPLSWQSDRPRTRRAAPVTDPEVSSSPGVLLAALLIASSAMISYGLYTGVFASAT